jgi:hypothetical protein
MFRNLFIVVAIFGLTVMQYGCGGNGDDGNGNGPGPVPEPRLVVTAHQDPTFDNALDSPVWDSIDAETVPVGTDNNYNANTLYTETLNADLKALVAGDSILYIMVKWSDNSEDNRFGELHATWANDIEWETVDTTDIRNEDRFYIMFDDGGAGGADCAHYCHSSSELSSAGRRHYGLPGDAADIWQWKAHRTGLGKFAEDMHLTDTMILQDPQVASSDSLYFGNLKTNLKATYMHEDGITYEGAGLLESETTNGLFTPYDNNLDWVTFPPNQDPIGKYLPGYFIYDESGADGSRWDVRAASQHDGSNWTVVFRRALTTADADDIDLSSVDSIQISIAITDNSGVKHHGRKPFYLVFE